MSSVTSKLTNNSNIGYHLVAFVTVAIWGSTFVFTKMLLQSGLSPAQIFTLRFIIAYFLLLLYESRVKSLSFRLFCKTWRDELLMVGLGITGGSVYFMAENAAMLYTTATNTSLIVCSCPLFAMLFVAMFYRHSEPIRRMQVLGSVIACMGMVVVVLNGHFVLHLSPKGDLLAFGACLCWAVYSLLVKATIERYSTIFITRKVFFYGLLTIIPYYILNPSEITLFTIHYSLSRSSSIFSSLASLPRCSATLSGTGSLANLEPLSLPIGSISILSPQLSLHGGSSTNRLPSGFSSAPS